MILLAMLLFPSTPMATTPSRVEASAHSVERAAAALDPHIIGVWLDRKPGTEQLVEAQWRAVHSWTIDWLDAHPQATAKALEAASARFGDAWSITAVPLGDGDVLVAASHYQIATAFILGSHGGGYRMRWSIADYQASLDAKADRALAFWRPRTQNARCSGDCRIVGGSSIGRLPDSTGSAKRFWIGAYYAQEVGATFGAQLSLWSWRNGRAQPLLVHDFVTAADQPGPVFRSGILYVRSKRFWDSIYACGSCAGRETDLRFAIEPTRVRALPPVPLTPEIDVVDQVFSRVLARRPVGALASPSAVRVIRRQLADTLADTDPQTRDLAGMVMGWQRWTTSGKRWACLSVDGAGATAFAFDHARTRITAARALGSNACSGRDART